MREQRVRENSNKTEPYLVHELNEFCITSRFNLEKMCVRDAAVIR